MTAAQIRQLIHNLTGYTGEILIDLQMWNKGGKIW